MNKIVFSVASMAVLGASILAGVKLLLDSGEGRRQMGQAEAQTQLETILRAQFGVEPDKAIVVLNGAREQGRDTLVWLRFQMPPARVPEFKQRILSLEGRCMDRRRFGK